MSTAPIYGSAYDRPMFSRSAAFYDAVYSWKDYAAEAATVHGLIQLGGRARPRARRCRAGLGGHLRHLCDLYQAEGLDLDREISHRRSRALPERPAPMSAT